MEVETAVVEVAGGVGVDVDVDVDVVVGVVEVVVVISAATASPGSSVAGVRAAPTMITAKDVASTQTACFRDVTPKQPSGRTRLNRPKRSPPRPKSPSSGPIGCR